MTSNLATSSSTWVFDTTCVTHIVNNVQGLRSRRKLEKGEGTVRVGNGAKVDALEVGIFELFSATGLVIKLNDCHFVPIITRNIISIPILDREGFSFSIMAARFVSNVNALA